MTAKHSTKSFRYHSDEIVYTTLKPPSAADKILLILLGTLPYALLETFLGLTYDYMEIRTDVYSRLNSTEEWEAPYAFPSAAIGIS